MMTYSHTFKDGHKLTLVVDFSGNLPKMKSSPYPPGNEAEYKLWRDTVVAPDVLNRMSRKQLEDTASMVLLRNA